MQHVRLGAAGPATSRLGLGCLSFSGGHDAGGAVDAAGAADALIGRALDAGVSLFDVADPSAGGDGLRLVGRAVGARRAEALIAAHAWPAPQSPEDVLRKCDTALRRLAVDHIDLYYLHPSDPASASAAAVPIEERIRPLANLVEAGKVRYLGLYDPTGSDLVRAHAVHPMTALAVEYSLAAPSAEDELLPLARGLGIGVVACRPLGEGLLTGRVTGPRLERSRLLRGLRAVAADLDIGVSRLALAWLLSRGDDIVPVPGTGSPVHLEMNLLSLDVELPPEAGRRLSELLDDAQAEDGLLPRPHAQRQS